MQVTPSGLIPTEVKTTEDDCASELSIQLDLVVVGIEDNLASAVRLYPMPVEDKMYIELHLRSTAVSSLRSWICWVGSSSNVSLTRTRSIYLKCQLPRRGGSSCG